jgi:hypothetical protein
VSSRFTKENPVILRQFFLRMIRSKEAKDHVKEKDFWIIFIVMF